MLRSSVPNPDVMRSSAHSGKDAPDELDVAHPVHHASLEERLQLVGQEEVETTGASLALVVLNEGAQLRVPWAQPCRRWSGCYCSLVPRKFAPADSAEMPMPEESVRHQAAPS